MDVFVDILGRNGLIGVIGFVIFLFSLHYSQAIFAWIENQTFGTRSYIMEKLEFLHVEIEPDRVTYLLLFCSIGLGSLTVVICAIFGKWILGFILGLFLSFLGFKLPKPIINMLVERRIKEYSSQMVDGLQLLSNGIRAGLSVPQSIGMIVDEMPPPISQEVNILLQQTKIGVTLE